MALDVDKTLWMQSGYYFAHLQRAVVLESVRKWVTETTHTLKGHMYTIRWADVTYGTCQNCNMVCYFVTVEGHFWAHLWNPTVTRTPSTISWNYSGQNAAYGEKQQIVSGCSVCGHWGVHCLLFCFIVCTKRYIVLVSMHFCNGSINFSVRHFGYSFINHLLIQLSKLSAASAVSLSVGLSLNYSVRLVVVTYHG
jgi:hypothetical protein